MINLTIAPEVASRHPGVLVGAFLAENVDGSAVANAPTAELVRCSIDALAAAGLSLETLTADPRIADWRQAIKLCGISASRWRSSAEQMGRRFVKGEAFSTPHALVTAYCAISARNLAPLGAYDFERLTDTWVTLRGWRRGDRFDPIAGAEDDFIGNDDLVVYACDSEIISYAWNVRDSKRTCITSETSVAMLIGEAATIRQQLSCRTALGEIATWLAGRGVRVSPIYFVDGSARSVSIPLAYL